MIRPNKKILSPINFTIYRDLSKVQLYLGARCTLKFLFIPPLVTCHKHSHFQGWRIYWQLSNQPVDVNSHLAILSSECKTQVVLYETK